MEESLKFHIKVMQKFFLFFVKKLLTKRKSCDNINKLTGENKAKEFAELVKNLDN